MSKPIFSDAFVFRGVRRNRQSFLFSLAFQALGWAVIAMGGYRLLADDWSPGIAPSILAELPVLNMLLLALMGLASVPLVLLHLAAGTQRCRDCGITGWAALALLVPPLNAPMLLALAVCPGHDGPNKFGANPLRRQEVATRFDAMLEMKTANK